MSGPQPGSNAEPKDGASLQIVQERTVKAFEFTHRRTPMRANTALVLLTAKGRHQVVYPPDRPTTGELFWKRIRTVYEVDLGQHLSSFETDIPSRGDALPFHATVDIQWRVKKPYEIVQRRIDTSRALIDAIRPELLGRMRRVSRDFDVHESESAESKINTELHTPLGAGLGLWTRPYVRLSLEQSTIAHLSEVLDLQRKIKIEEHANRLRWIADGNQRDLLSRRITFYQKVISDGDIEQFAMRIAHNESDLSAAIEAFHHARNTDHRNVIDFFTQLTESGLIERYEMSDRVREALDWLNKSVTRVLGIDDHLTNTGRRRRPSGSTNVPPALPPIVAPPSDQTAPHGGADGRPPEGGPDSGTG
ncbi:MAG: SPFH domain-containing protein [Pseudonocardiaceae bacterium]